jgi:hypothetical protein
VVEVVAVLAVLSHHSGVVLVVVFGSFRVVTCMEAVEVDRLV